MENIKLQTVREMLIQYQKKTGKTNSEVAKKLKLSRSMVCYYKNEQYTAPLREKTLSRIIKTIQKEIPCGDMCYSHEVNKYIRVFNNVQKSKINEFNVDVLKQAVEILNGF